MKKYLLWVVAGLLLIGPAIAAGKKSKSSSTEKTVHVRSYERKDGTVVKAFERAAPHKAAKPLVDRPAPKSKTMNAPKAATPIARTEDGRIARSAAAKRDFVASHRCPGVGNASGGCPGYVIDHIKPLACGGADAPANMQWQTIEQAKAKDRWERNGCK